MYRGNLCKKLFTWSNSFHTNGPQFFSSWSQIRFWLETLIFSRESQVQPAYQLSSKSNSVFVRVMLKDFKVLPRWWLPTCQRFIYKLSVLTYDAFHIGQPYYLADLHVIDLFRPSRCLSSTNCHLLAVPSCAKPSFASRAFCVSSIGILSLCISAYLTVLLLLNSVLNLTFSLLPITPSYSYADASDSTCDYWRYINICLALTLFHVWCCQLGELCDAEDALIEANVLDNLEPEVWAYLCLLCLDTGRDVEAEQAYKYTLKVRCTRYNIFHLKN